MISRGLDRFINIIFLYNSIMIELNIPGRGLITLEHLVCDVNGTLAIDGRLIEGVSRRLRNISDRLQIHLLTADTHGRQDLIDRQLGLQAKRLKPGNERQQKADYILELGAGNVAAIGQGANDADMLKNAALGICVISREGVAVQTMIAADLIVPDIETALELLEYPIRILASLRE